MMRSFVVACVAVTLLARYALRVIAATGTAFLIVAGLAVMALWYRGHDPQADWLVWPAAAVAVAWVADIEFRHSLAAVVTAYRKRLANDDTRQATRSMLVKSWR